MLRRFLIGLVVRFLSGQFGQWRDSLDWTKIRGDVEDLIRDFIRNDFLANEAVRWSMALIDVAESILQAQKEIEEIIGLIADSKFDEAWTKLRELILSRFTPTKPEHEQIVKLCKDCDTLHKLGEDVSKLLDEKTA
jgi:hypothetical protein